MIRYFEPLKLQEKYLSGLTVVEVRSAIRRRERMGDITRSDAQAAVSAFAAEIADMQAEPWRSRY